MIPRLRRFRCWALDDLDGPGDGGQDLDDPFLLDVANPWRFAKADANWGWSPVGLTIWTLKFTKMTQGPKAMVVAPML